MKVKVIKVKAYSDNTFNNIVDKIAKEGTNKDILEINYNSSTLKGISTFKDFVININSRQFMKHLLDAQNFEKWLNLKRNEIDIKKSLKKFDWKFIFKNFHAIDKDNRFTSFSQRDNTSFRGKIFMNELPTLDKLKIRRPDLYKTWKCPRYNRVEENLHHL